MKFVLNDCFTRDQYLKALGDKVGICALGRLNSTDQGKQREAGIVIASFKVVESAKHKVTGLYIRIIVHSYNCTFVIVHL